MLKVTEKAINMKVFLKPRKICPELITLKKLSKYRKLSGGTRRPLYKYSLLDLNAIMTTI
jgi:hypothetical protein